MSSAGGYQQVIAEPIEDLELGLEAGVAARLGAPSSAEVWGGAFVRYDGFVIGDIVASRRPLPPASAR